MRIHLSDGRTVTVTADGDCLVLTEKPPRRGAKPVQHRLEIARLLAGDATSVVDALVRRLPIADLGDIRPERVGYELKARLLKLLRHEQS